jgi:hypothetical protein
MSGPVDVDLPGYEGTEVVVSAPDVSPGNWAGDASCVLVDAVFWLADRIRRALHSGTGVTWLLPGRWTA